jgi:hypothetical protein
MCPLHWVGESIDPGDYERRPLLLLVTAQLLLELSDGYSRLPRAKGRCPLALPIAAWPQ